MFDSHLHYLLEKQRHEMERRQAHEYWLHRRLLGVNPQKDFPLYRSLHCWLAATLNRWRHRFNVRETLTQPTERLRSPRTSMR